MFQPQIDGKPDIVVLQFGENIDGGSLDTVALKNSLETLVTGLKNSSNPNIFITSFILGANSTIDAIKRQVVAEDPSHRVFVDLSAVSQDATNLGGWGHPNDRGMALIANRFIVRWMPAWAPEPGAMALLTTGMIALFIHIFRKCNSSRATRLAKCVFISYIASLGLFNVAAPAEEAKCSILTPVPIGQVTIDDEFWSPKRKVWQEVTIPDVLAKLEKDGVIRNTIASATD